MNSPESPRLHFLVPVSLLIGVSVAYSFRDGWLDLLVGLYPDKLSVFYTVSKIFLALLLLLGSWSFLSLSDVFLWQRLERRNGRPVPGLLTGIYTFALTTITGMAMLIAVLEQSVIEISLLVGGLILVVLVFFRDLFTDLMAGLSINLDPSINLGDTIALASAEPGVLTEVNWRSTHLRAGDHSMIVIPNNVFAKSTLVNFSVMKDVRQVGMDFILDASLPVHRVIRVLNAVICSVQEDGFIVSEPAPKNYADGLAEYGIRYQLAVCFDAKEQTESAVRTALVDRIVQHFEKAGLQFTIPKQQLVMADAAATNRNWDHQPHRHTLLQGFDIFRPLDTDELGKVSSQIIVHTLPVGAKIIEQYSEGSAMYGLAEGFLGVTVDRSDSPEVRVGSINPGQFFGEMSLLVGEARTATVTALVESVVFEIPREIFYELIDNRPEIANMISRAVAERQLANSMAIESSESERQMAINKAADSLYSRMKAIFGGLLK
jgi:small-conductance mechanosensitive channel/CRP-like cAMP-binding protein